MESEIASFVGVEEGIANDTGVDCKNTISSNVSGDANEITFPIGVLGNKEGLLLRVFSMAIGEERVTA
jgi:hypothetical protein